MVILVLFFMRRKVRDCCKTFKLFRSIPNPFRFQPAKYKCKATQDRKSTFRIIQVTSVWFSLSMIKNLKQQLRLLSARLTLRLLNSRTMTSTFRQKFSNWRKKIWLKSIFNSKGRKAIEQEFIKHNLSKSKIIYLV